MQACLENGGTTPPKRSHNPSARTLQGSRIQSLTEVPDVIGT